MPGFPSFCHPAAAASSLKHAEKALSPGPGDGIKASAPLCHSVRRSEVSLSFLFLVLFVLSSLEEQDQEEQDAETDDASEHIQCDLSG